MMDSKDDVTELFLSHHKSSKYDRIIEIILWSVPVIIVVTLIIIVCIYIAKL